MSIITFAEVSMRLKLSYHQKQLLEMLAASPSWYLHDVISKKPTQEIKTVSDVYEKYHAEVLVAV